MTKEELISLYPTVTPDERSFPWVFIICLVLAAIFLVIHVKAKIKGIWDDVLKTGVIVCLIVGFLTAILDTGSLFVKGFFESSDRSELQANWYKESFPKYLDTLPKETVEVLDKTLNSDGSYTVAMKAGDKIVTLRVSELYTTNLGYDYLEYQNVEGLSKYHIKDGRYNQKLFINNLSKE